MSIVILGVLAVVLTDSLRQVLTRRIYESAVQSALQREFDNSPGSHLVEVRFDEADRSRSIVRAVVRGPNPPSAAQVTAMEATLPAHPGRRPVELRVRFVPTTIINRDGVLLQDAAFHGGE